MKLPRGLSAGEQAAWAHLARSVTPLPGRASPQPDPKPKATPPAPPKAVLAAVVAATPAAMRQPHRAPPPPPPPPPPVADALDSHWDRRMKGGRIAPDLTLDLHGHTLDTAYDRIMAGLDQARAMNARVVLVIAGRARPVDPADRMARRGAIRAKLLDWLAASRHAGAIAAVRKAHVSHGGEGALYLVLKRPR
ncbi:MAG: Smr/MutS family protein [Erythrobacteraceae bacterium]|nr:Smr/MutS family protein [Erythrobacteraceae bacterium]